VLDNGGVYFISGTLTLTGGAWICTLTPGSPNPLCQGPTTTALFILLPGGSLDTKGGGTIDITGNPSVAPSKLPSALQSYVSLFANMAIYKIPDPDTSKNGPNEITIGGNSNITFKGTMYLPTANVTFQGNPTIDLGGTTGCGELIAKSVAFNGNATLNSNGCSAATKPVSQYVQLVQ
jgi:hypothetical protein